MKLVDIITLKNEKPIEKLEYFSNQQINFLTAPVEGYKFMYTGDDRKIYKTAPIIRINQGGNYLILETENDAYVFVEDEDAED